MTPAQIAAAREERVDNAIAEADAPKRLITLEELTPEFVVMTFGGVFARIWPGVLTRVAEELEKEGRIGKTA